MGYALIAPELVILWAARQHYGAKYLAEQHQRRGWTMTHGFFVIMGGFTLHDERGTPLRILEPIELESLSEAGKIEWPSITEEEIQDRSKGDYLSKGIVLVQTSWFIAQCIVRGAYKLEVTELEVATLAFAAMTGVTYYLWWNKPLDVRCSVPVYLLKDEKEKGHSQRILSVSPTVNPVSVSPPISCDLNSNHVDSKSSKSEETQILQVTSHPRPNPQEPITSNSPHHIASGTPEPKVTRIRQFSAFIQRQRQKHGIVLGLAYVFLLYPFVAFFRTFGDVWVSETLHDSVPLRVPTFYAPKYTSYSSAFIVGAIQCVAVVFGGIHCVAWSFHFPSLQEKLAWRISAASVTGLPILVMASTLLVTPNNDVENWSNLSRFLNALWMPTATVIIVLYVIARIILLVLPCIALRALHPTAFVEIEWAALFPHIG